MSQTDQAPTLVDPFSSVESYRLYSTPEFAGEDRADLGQFYTTAPTARFMASFLKPITEDVRLLDPGAGAGVLLLAAVVQLLSQSTPPKSISVTAVEIEPAVQQQLASTVELCKALCIEKAVPFTSEIVFGSFVDVASCWLQDNLFDPDKSPRFNLVIQNPPYKKLNTDSSDRATLRQVRIEVNNYYSAFLWLSARLMTADGQLVAITPRSFCNGPYFRPLRVYLDRETFIDHVHTYHSRSKAFKDDAVLQENIIFHLQKLQDHAERDNVVITSNNGPDDLVISQIEVPYETFIRPTDPDRVMHIVTDELGLMILQQTRTFSHTLQDLGLTVSTGRVVDFRARGVLCAAGTPSSVPLIYPAHFEAGYVLWPDTKGKKRTAILDVPATEDVLIPSETYVLVKRFSSKEEKKRIVSVVYDATRIPADRVGFENHLNYVHRDGAGLPVELARGLSVYLNSTLVDEYFRLFNGHTQVNAADLRMLPYPSTEQLEQLGQRLTGEWPDQRTINEMIAELTDSPNNPVRSMQRIQEARQLLKEIGVPKGQQNARSALVLLAVANVKPDTLWDQAEIRRIGVTPMMEFFAEHYGKSYAPNSRETVRKESVHQFLQEGILLMNTDDPSRPVNSKLTVYELSPAALKLLQSFGTSEWPDAVQQFKEYRSSIQSAYGESRHRSLIPVTLPDGSSIELTAGGQNPLIKMIIEEFCARYTPSGLVLYVGDAGDKVIVFDETRFAELGLHFDLHGKMPDVVIHHTSKNWLLLIEAVSTHGPVNTKRHRELKDLFKNSRAGLVFVTAFMTRREMMAGIKSIAWETEVWNAEEPDHMIHFNGDRFLGPYEK